MSHLGNASQGPHLCNLLGVQKEAVVVSMALQRQPIALDGVAYKRSPVLEEEEKEEEKEIRRRRRRRRRKIRRERERDEE